MVTATRPPSPSPSPPSEATEKRVSLLRCRDVTGVDKVGPFRAEDDAGHQDESSDQQGGEKIEQHQEPQQHEEGLDTPAKVSCGTKVLLTKRRWTKEAALTCRLTSNQLQCFSPRGEQIEELSGALFESTQEFGSLSSPGVPFGNRGRPHLLHLPAMERKTSGKAESGGSSKGTWKHVKLEILLQRRYFSLSWWANGNRARLWCT